MCRGMCHMLMCARHVTPTISTRSSNSLQPQLAGVMFGFSRCSDCIHIYIYVYIVVAATYYMYIHICVYIYILYMYVRDNGGMMV